MALRLKMRCDQVTQHEGGLTSVSLYPAQAAGIAPPHNVSGHLSLNVPGTHHGSPDPFRPGRDYWVEISAVESIE